MPDLREMLKKGPVILDGATGTNLQKAGMPMGVCPEQWILEHREIMQDLERQFADAGSDIIYAPTFTASRIKLAEYHLQDQVVSMNQELVKLAKEAVGDRCLIAGDMTMTGKMLAPLGPLSFDDLVDCYKEQARSLADAGVDLFVIETMMHVGEARAALLAVKEITDLPVMVTMTVEDSGKTMYGTDAVTALVTLQSMGADAVGLNCSTGPDKLLPLIAEMKEYATVPLIAKPNAGLPKLITGETVFDMNAQDFAGHMKKLVEAGAAIVGGCCGTTPEYIRLLADTVRGMDVYIPKKKSIRVLTGEHSRTEIDLNGPFEVIGERINPTGKPALRAQLKEHCFDMVQDMAVSQVENGAKVLDINVGMSGIDEEQMMLDVIDAVNEVVDIPLCIDSSSPKVVEAALRHYHGRALVNSISCEHVKLEMLPIVKKYGAMFIMLPLTDEGLPENFEQRKENLHTILHAAYAQGFSKEDVLADGLVATLGANSHAGQDTLCTIAYCHDELGIATVCGLSNISFGLPDRSYVNSIFLALAISKGLTMAIANPSQELLMRSASAADLVMDKPEANLRYIETAGKYKERKEEETAAQAQEISDAVQAILTGKQRQSGRENKSGGGSHKKKTKKGTEDDGKPHGSLPSQGKGSKAGQDTASETTLEAPLQAIFDDVLKGKKKHIEEHIEEALSEGFQASDILNQALVPGINAVGDYYNAKKYFLPQLMLSAETMQKGVGRIEPLLSTDAGSAGYTVVIATVEGDIHDIGKNLVAMMMKNYGFHVIDLGKDVKAQVIVDSAIENHADIVALSALMTTTMQKMREVVNLVKEKGLSSKVIIGGAVITQDYADEIGADGYSEDAVGAVALVKRLMGETS